MNNSEYDLKRFFSEFSSSNLISIKDIDLNESDYNSPEEKKALKLLRKIKSLELDKERSTDEALKEDQEIMQEAAKVLEQLINTGTINKDVFYKAMTHAAAEMLSFAVHEPDHHLSLNEEQNKLLKENVLSILSDSGMKIDQASFEEMYPELLKKHEFLTAKTRTPRS